MEAVITTLKETTYTKTRLLHRLGILQHVLERVFYQAASDTPVRDAFTEELRAYAEPDDIDALAQLGTDWVLEMSESSVPTALQSAHESIEAAPTLTVYVPAVFDEPAEAELGKWCRAELDAQMLLELEVDPNVVGGCAVIAHNTLHEYSLRTELAAQPDLLAKLVSQYES